ncbi:AI-2E family transporter [Halomarina rubra]|uniref:AI-2E family transporter n=1 Tax=Halomarina rubra TaxID=2071873 RepID=A0ABD6AR24_9EURY|nr:AI-2E family transporter [Halomarina rubra]
MSTESERSGYGGHLTPQTAFWWAVAALVGLLLLWVGFVYVGTFALGLFVYYATRPVNKRIERRFGGAKRSALISLFAVVLPFIVILGLVIASVASAVAGARGLISGQLAGFIDPYLDSIAAIQTPQQAVDYFQSLAADATVQGGLDAILGTVGTLGGAVYQTFLIAAFVYFLLRDDSRLAAWFDREVADEDSPVSRYFRAVDLDLESVYYGQLLTIFAVIVISMVLYVGLNLVAPAGMDIPQPVLFAALTGVATFIPLVGRGIVYTIIAAYLSFVAVTTDPVLLWYPLVFLFVTFWGLDNVVRYFVRPRLAGRDVPASLLLFTYLLGGGLWGWYGIFLAPFLFVLSWEFLRTVFPRLVRGEPIETGIPPTDLPTTEQSTLDDGDDIGPSPKGT